MRLREWKFRNGRARTRTLIWNVARSRCPNPRAKEMIERLTETSASPRLQAVVVRPAPNAPRPISVSANFERIVIRGRANSIRTKSIDDDCTGHAFGGYGLENSENRRSPEITASVSCDARRAGHAADVLNAVFSPERASNRVGLWVISVPRVD